MPKLLTAHQAALAGALYEDGSEVDRFAALKDLSAKIAAPAKDVQARAANAMLAKAVSELSRRIAANDGAADVAMLAKQAASIQAQIAEQAKQLKALCKASKNETYTFEHQRGHDGRIAKTIARGQSRTFVLEHQRGADGKIVRTMMKTERFE
jgi:hypothetical protein